MNPLLTITETAQALTISPSTVRRMIRRGELPAVQIGRQWRIPPDDLAAHVKTLSERTTR